MRRLRPPIPRTRHAKRTPPHPHRRHALHVRILRQELPLQGRADHAPPPTHRRTPLLVPRMPAPLHQLAQLQQAHEAAARHQHERDGAQAADDTADGHAATEPAGVGAGAAAARDPVGGVQRGAGAVLSGVEFVQFAGGVVAAEGVICGSR